MDTRDTLNDDLSDLLDGETVARPAVSAKVEALVNPEFHVENCKKCHGSGRFVSWSGRVLGPCHACKGLGKRAYKTSSADRAKARTQARDRDEKVKINHSEAFAAKHPEMWAWLKANPTFDFATQMMVAIAKFGDLTDGQFNAVQKCIDRAHDREVERLARLEAAPAVTLEKIEAAFVSAVQHGLKSPKLNLDTFKFSPAKATSSNVGAIYVKEDGTYLGKIMGGKFVRVRECNDQQEARILAACADPAKAAEAYGIRTGSCACCGRELTNAESIARSIGPICARKYGW